MTIYARKPRVFHRFSFDEEAMRYPGGAFIAVDIADSAFRIAPELHTIAVHPATPSVGCVGIEIVEGRVWADFLDRLREHVPDYVVLTWVT